MRWNLLACLDSPLLSTFWQGQRGRLLTTMARGIWKLFRNL
uniref:Uncharacterized protein n=1 Tax=Anguilla anguilla TaxID=7936 RepID=A0A0E9PQM2_ANGAN